jgi:hypothetical protein
MDEEKKNPEGTWSLEGGIRVTGMNDAHVSILRDDVGTPMLSIGLLVPDKSEADIHRDKIYGLLVKRAMDGTVLGLQVDFTRELDYDALEFGGYDEPEQG